MTGFENSISYERPISGPNSMQLHEKAARPRLGRYLLRSAADAAAAGVFFVIASMTLASAPSSANPGAGTGDYGHMLISQGTATGAQIVSQKSFAAGGVQLEVKTQVSNRQVKWAILSVAFSLLAALNLAFFRHLRRVYANPRKRAARASGAGAEASRPVTE
jgi:hypothetical protein